MPTLAELKTTLLGLSDDHLGRFNIMCDSKAYNAFQGVGEQNYTVPDDLASDIDELDATDFATLQGMMPNTRKLNERPC